jgi:hypothetical protein
MSVSDLSILVFGLAAAWPAVSRAETTDTSAEPERVTRAAAIDDVFTPLLKGAESHGQAIATAVAQYNGASSQTTVDLNGEIQIIGPLRLVLRVDSIGAPGERAGRPGIGAAVQLLTERTFGVSSSAYFVYKAEGLIAFGKQFGAVHSTLNLAYGQDPEGNERDGEIALGLHIEPIRDVFTGVVARYRDALGSNGDKGTGVLRDMLGGVTATVAIGKIGVTGTAGFAAVETITSGSLQGGALAAVSIGAVF